MYLILRDGDFIDQTVGANSNPFYTRIVRAHLPAQVFSGMLIVRMRRNQQADQTDNPFFRQRDGFPQIVIATTC